MGSLLLSIDLGSTQISSQQTPGSCVMVQELNYWRPLGSPVLRPQRLLYGFSSTEADFHLPTTVF